jgi:hypothetical protein
LIPRAHAREGCEPRRVPAPTGHASEGCDSPAAPAGAVSKAEPTEKLKAAMARAKMAIRPEVGAAFVIAEFGGHPDVAALAVQLEIDMNDIAGARSRPGR